MTELKRYAKEAMVALLINDTTSCSSLIAQKAFDIARAMVEEGEEDNKKYESTRL